MKITNNNHKHPISKSFKKRFAIVLLLVLMLWVLSSCYMDPEDTNTGDPNPGGVQQTFESILTPTPAPTAVTMPSTPPATIPTTPPATVVPTATNQASDWSNFNFGDQTSTTPPISTLNPYNQPTIMPTTNTGLPSGATAIPSVSTPIPAATAPASASDSLKIGAQGQVVRDVQKRLKELGYYRGSVDGDYGTGTAEAVQHFQARNGLTPDGICGAATKNKLFSASAVPNTSGSSTGLTTSGSHSGSSSGSSSSGSSSGSNNTYTSGKTNIYLKLGSQGSEVKNMQNRLIYLGYMAGSADGKFASTTQSAVMAFQKRHSLNADGVAGPGTLTKLYSSSARRASSTAVAIPLSAVKPGMEGDVVRAIQSRLRKLGYLKSSPDGSYGEATTKAVLRFQEDNGLTPDGICGTATVEKLFSINTSGSGSGSSSGSGGGGSSSSTAPSNYGKNASSNGMKTISSSSNSTNVQQLQSALSSTGYYSGTLDGSYGGGTEKAVKNFQSSRGLRVTGLAGPTTQRLLYGGTSESGSYSKLEVGYNGSKVKTLQYALYELKYYDGAITGNYDQATQNAVLAFQDINGLYVDGIAGADTQRRLYSSNAIPND